MKKESFIVLLIVELLAGMVAMGLLLSDLGAYCYLVAAVLFTVVLTPFFMVLKKTEDQVKKTKIRRNILLVMLTPTVIAVGTIVYFVVGMMLYFS